MLILHFNIYSKDVFRSFEPFRAVLASTDCKKYYYKQKLIFGNKFNIDTTNAEFDANFEKKLKTVNAKKTIKNPFVGEFFLQFFPRIQNQHRILPFFIPIIAKHFFQF